VATAIIGIIPIFVLVPLPYVCTVREGSKGQASLRILTSFAAGGLLGDSFLHLIPHSLDPHDHEGQGQVHDETCKTVDGDYTGNQECNLIQQENEHDHDDDDDDHGHDHHDDDHHHDNDHDDVHHHGHDHDDVHHHDHEHGHDDDHEHDHWRVQKVMYLILAGIVLFFIVERCSLVHDHSHSSDNAKISRGNSDGNSHKEEEKHRGSLVNILADCTHNLTDGLAIAASFSKSYQLGISTSIAVFIHEIPHEIGDYGILIMNGLTHWQAIGIQFVTALASMVGCIGGILMKEYHVEVDIASWALPITAGGFIYIAMVDVLADLIRENETSFLESCLQVSAMGAGVGMMTLVSILEE